MDLEEKTVLMVIIVRPIRVLVAVMKYVFNPTKAFPGIFSFVLPAWKCELKAPPT